MPPYGFFHARCKHTGEVKKAPGFCSYLDGKNGKQIKDAVMHRIRSAYRTKDSEFNCDANSVDAGTCTLR